MRFPIIILCVLSLIVNAFLHNYFKKIYCIMQISIIYRLVINLNIGELINKTRNYQNISMNKLAKLADVSQSSLSRIESGTNYPTFDVLERIITALGFSLAEFFSEEKQNIDPSITRLLQVANRLTVEEREALIHYLTIRLKE